MKKKKSVRNSKKRPELDPTMNLKGRQDYMDTDYINGVYDKDGNELIRPMTSKEKDFLAQFYKETLNADNRNSKFYSTEEEWKDIYGENNARNRCLLNQSKKMGKLDRFSIKDSDKKFIKELGDYDAELLNVEQEVDMFNKKLDNVIDRAIKLIKKK